MDKENWSNLGRKSSAINKNIGKIQLLIAIYPIHYQTWSRPIYNQIITFSDDLYLRNLQWHLAVPKVCWHHGLTPIGQRSQYTNRRCSEISTNCRAGATETFSRCISRHSLTKFCNKNDAFRRGIGILVNWHLSTVYIGEDSALSSSKYLLKVHFRSYVSVSYSYF